MGERVVDAAGAEWPVTGSWCEHCEMPTDPVLAGASHPLCEPADPDRLDELTGRWRRSSEPVRVLRPVLLPEPEPELTGDEVPEPEPELIEDDELGDEDDDDEDEF